MEQDENRIHPQRDDIQFMQAGGILVGLLLGIVDQSPESNLVQGV
jgi:hypothetical protein